MGESMLAALLFIAGLFIALVMCLAIGRRFAIWQHVKHAKSNEAPGINIAEGAIFGLVGLLIAFTFAGANTRFDVRRNLIVEEANAIITAYLRLDLVPAETRTLLQQNFRDYLDARLAIYQERSHGKDSDNSYLLSKKLQKIIWTRAISVSKGEANHAIAIVLLPALNNMFDIANTRMEVAKIHPPLVVFALLIALALMSALLAGYSMAGNKVYVSFQNYPPGSILGVDIPYQ